MRVSGISVPEAVKEIITRNRSIYDCMKMDLINYTALAIKIQSEVEKETGRAVNLNTIVVAIKRYADSFIEKEEIKDEFVLKDARLSLQDGIMDIKFSTKDSNMNPMDILDRFSKITSDYDFFRLADSFRFLTEDVQDIRKIFGDLADREDLFSTGLAKIRVSVPANQDRSDIVSYVAEVLHNNGIVIVNAFFSQDSITIILNEKDASKAYEILRTEITRTL